VARVVSVHGSSAAQAGIMILETLETRERAMMYWFDYVDVDFADGADEHGREQVLTSRWEAGLCLMDSW